jgi:hypothetical protein
MAKLFNQTGLDRVESHVHCSVIYKPLREWIKDPLTEISEQQMSRVLSRDANLNPWSSPWSQAFGLVPDFWYIPPEGDSTGEIPVATSVSKRSLMVGSPVVGNAGVPCSRATFGKTSGDVGFVEFRPVPQDPTRYCLIFAWVTYEAGAAECVECRLDLAHVVHKIADLVVKEDTFTQFVLDNMHWLTLDMVKLNYSTPIGFYDDLDEYASELLLRSYAGLWSYLTTIMGRPTDGSQTGSVSNVQIPTSGLRASVEQRRVAGWLVLNALVTLSGVLFVYLQISSGRPLITKPIMAALAIDSSGVIHQGERALCNFSYRTKGDDATGFLWLEDDETGRRKLKSG